MATRATSTRSSGPRSAPTSAAAVDAGAAVETNAASGTGAIPSGAVPSVLPEWMAQAAEQGIKPEQALAFIGLGLMRKMAESQQSTWMWSEEEDGGAADLSALRQRLELTDLAIRTAAPLSTAEVTQLLGARPGSAQVQRGGISARRVSRNVWKLSRIGGDDDSAERGAAGYGFSEGFRRRL